MTNKIYKERKRKQYKITALKLNQIVYRRERRGARLDKLILCPLKLRITKKLLIFNNKEKEKL